MPESTPLQFDVTDLHSASGAAAIERAVHEVDAKAQVAVDLETKRVVIGSDGCAQDFADAIQKAGFVVRAAA